MKVVWSEAVERELDENHAYLIETASPETATKVIAKIIARGEQIAIFPELGREVADFTSPSIREVVEGPYRIVYEIARDADRTFPDRGIVPPLCRPGGV